MSMNEQLQQSLSQILDQAVSGVQAGVSLFNAELPDVIHQLLMWKMVESLVMCIVGITLTSVMTYILIKYSGVGAKIKDSDSRWKTHHITLTHDEEGDIAPWIPATIAAPMLAALGFLSLVNIDWLKIWLAPKVYLIEYAASLVK